jgi:hypothetical protein
MSVSKDIKAGPYWNHGLGSSIPSASPRKGGAWLSNDSPASAYLLHARSCDRDPTVDGNTAFCPALSLVCMESMSARRLAEFEVDGRGWIIADGSDRTWFAVKVRYTIMVGCHTSGGGEKPVSVIENNGHLDCSLPRCVQLSLSIS